MGVQPLVIGVYGTLTPFPSTLCQDDPNYFYLTFLTYFGLLEGPLVEMGSVM